MDEARAFAAKLARGPLFALEVTKRRLDREAAMDFDAALADEVEMQAICMQRSRTSARPTRPSATKREPDFP